MLRRFALINPTRITSCSVNMIDRGCVTTSCWSFSKYHASSPARDYDDHDDNNDSLSSSSSSSFKLSQNQVIIASGNCVARHFRPTPENVNLDSLSEFLLQYQRRQQAACVTNTSTDANKNKNCDNEDESVNSSSTRIASITSIRRIMPPNAKAAAAVATSSTSVGSGSQSELLHRQKQFVNKNKNIKDLHSVDNLLLLHLNLVSSGASAMTTTTPSSSVASQERVVVVFPDSTIVAWGTDCIEEECEVIADFLFHNDMNNDNLMNRESSSSSFKNNNNKNEDLYHHQTHHQTLSSPPEHVEVESIQYQLVTSKEEIEKEVEAAVAEAANETTINNDDHDDVDDDHASSKNNNTTASSLSSATTTVTSSSASSTSSSALDGCVEVDDGLATLYGPFSNFSHYNCYPADLVVGEKKKKKINSNNNKNNKNEISEEEEAHEEAMINLALEMLPVVMAVAQSARVDAIDNYIVSKLANDVRHWQKELAFKGTLSQRFTLRDLRRSKAALLGVREEVSFALELEATPRLLRIANELKRFREAYGEVAAHFELEQRLEALESRVEAIDESLKYLHDERHAVLSEQMTVLIVVLIAMEISVAVYELCVDSSKEEEKKQREGEEAAVRSQN